MTIKEVQKKYSPIPTLDFDLLLAHAIKHNKKLPILLRQNRASSISTEVEIGTKEFVYSHPEYKLSIVQRLCLAYFIHLRKKGYSVAAITGHKEFYGLDFLVNKHVLIPRPDTELMVEETIRIINSELIINNNNTILIDVGTGSGCIPISIACHAKLIPNGSIRLISASQKIPPHLPANASIALQAGVRDDIQIFAIDNSNQALKVAKQNAKKHDVDITFLHGNLLEPLIKQLKTPSFILPLIGGDRSYTYHNNSPSPIRGEARGGVIITANLPYLTEKQFQAEPSIQREPKNALVAQNNGLALYEELLKQIKLLPTPHSLCLLLEIDPSQSRMILKIINRLISDSKIEIKKDLSGLDRLVVITKN